MSVSESDVIDMIGTDRETGDIVLTVSDHLGWGEDSKEHIAALQRKLERYVDFVQSGQIHEEYPQAAGRRVIIQVLQMIAPDSCGESWLVSARTQLAAVGLPLSWRVPDLDRYR